MAQTILAISLRQAKRAHEALADNKELYSKLEKGFPEVYYLPEYDENDPEAADNNEQLKADLDCQLCVAGISEFEFND